MRVRSFLDEHRRRSVNELVVRAMSVGSVDVLFRAWTDPNRLRRWVGGADFKVTPLFRELRRDGFWSLQVRSSRHRVRTWYSGVVHDCEVPSRLTFSMACEDPIEVSSPTMVTINLKQIGERTQIEIRQSGFSTESERRAYRMIWSSALRGLRTHMQARQEHSARLLLLQRLLTPFRSREAGDERALG